MMVRRVGLIYENHTSLNALRKIAPFNWKDQKNHDTKESRNVVRGRDPSANIRLYRGTHPNRFLKVNCTSQDREKPKL